MLTRLQRGRSDRVGDAGMTLIELTVGMTLMTIVGALALNFFLGATAQANRVTEQSLVGGGARVAMSQIAKTLQVADTPTANSGYSSGRFVTVAANEITFYSNISATGRSGTALRSAPTKVDFTLSNGTLTESLYAPQGSTAPASYPAMTAPTTKIILAANVANAPNQPLFTYCSDATDPSTNCTAPTDPTAVAMVQVTIVLQGKAGTTPQTVQSGIAITGQVS